ncbi:CDP-diacylglycerol--glycerol-3-phosphate 3-phosphatidyltransferase, partial [Xenoophorus captivus]
ARIRTAQRRVVMASLYLGTGQLEQELVDCMEEALQHSKENSRSPDLKVSVLLDYTRGSRGQINSRTMLLPLLQRFASQMRVSLYHTPDLRGLLRLLVPQRFNETIGVQHIKVYLFDDSIIISGANLSDSYFTNRQDRYVLLENCGEVADFFSNLAEAVGDISLQLQPDNSVTMLEGMVHPYKAAVFLLFEHNTAVAFSAENWMIVLQHMSHTHDQKTVTPRSFRHFLPLHLAQSVSMATRKSARILSSGEEAHYGGRQLGPHETAAAAATLQRGRGRERG